jgi:predicted membrane protein
MTTHGRLWLGGLLILIGIVFLLENAGVWAFRDVVERFWPILLILWGVSILLRRRSPKERNTDEARAHVVGDIHTALDQEYLNETNVFGEVEVRVTSKNFRGGNVSTVFGNIRVDCADATLAEGENVLGVSGVFGNIRICVPRSVPVALNANTLFGSVRLNDDSRSGIAPTLNYESPEYRSAPRKIRLRVSQVFGDVEVRQ